MLSAVLAMRRMLAVMERLVDLVMIDSEICKMTLRTVLWFTAVDENILLHVRQRIPPVVNSANAFPVG